MSTRFGPRRRRSFEVRIRIEHPALLQAELHGGDGEDDDEEHDALGRGVAGAAVGEGVANDLLDHDRRRAGRAALGHHPHLVEHLEAVDQADHDHEEQRRREQRDRDAAQPLPRAGAVDGGRLVEALGDRLQPGEQDDHDEAEVLPRRGEDDRRHRPGLRRPPADPRDADLGERPVDDAVVGVEQPLPQQRHHDPARDDREEVHRAEERHAAEGAVHEQGQSRGRRSSPAAGSRRGSRACSAAPGGSPRRSTARGSCRGR